MAVLPILVMVLVWWISVSCSDLLVSQNEIGEIDTFQALIQIYNTAFAEVYQIEEAEKYIYHFENKDHTYTGNLPVLILSHKFIPTIGYGNNLCRWLNMLACAHTAGYHVVSVNLNVRDQEQLPMDNRSSYAHKPTAFELALPTIVMNPNPSNGSAESIEFLKQCVRTSSSWEFYMPGGMYTQYEFLSEIGVKACDAYLHSRFGHNSSEYVLRHEDFDEVHPPTSFSGANQSLTHPLFPDALIVLRCADVLTWGGGYGFVNFHVYSRLIPASARTIYINSEPLVYNPMHHSQTEERQELCRELAGALISFLRARFPDALITVRRGDAHLSMIQIAKTAVVISAPSTFTLLPGLANTHAHHKVYMPRTNLFANNFPGDVHMSPQFHWISSPKEIIFPNMRNLRDKDAVNKFYQLLTDPSIDLVYTNSTNR